MAPIVGGSLLGVFAYEPALSFKAVYLVCGIAGIISFVFILRLPSPTEQVKIRKTHKEILEPLKAVLTDKIILLTCVIEASILFAYGTFETFLPLYSKSIGLTAYEIGILLSAQIITLALTKPLMGRFSDKHGRKPQILFGTIMGSFCIGSFFFFKAFIALLAISILFGLCLSIVTSATSAFIADLSKQSTRGSAMGTLGSIMDIGHTAGPIIAGMIASQFGIGYSFLGASLMLIAMATLFFANVMMGSTTKIE